MEQSEIIIYAIIGLIFEYAVIYFAISNATARQRDHIKVQTKLLEKMARKAGVSEDEIKDAYIINNSSPW